MMRNYRLSVDVIVHSVTPSTQSSLAEANFMQCERSKFMFTTRAKRKQNDLNQTISGSNHAGRNLLYKSKYNMIDISNGRSTVTIHIFYGVFEAG